MFRVGLWVHISFLKSGKPCQLMRQTASTTELKKKNPVCFFPLSREDKAKLVPWGERTFKELPPVDMNAKVGELITGGGGGRSYTTKPAPFSK